MAASGAKVLQLRSVEYARTHGVRIHCRSSFEDGPGTVVARRRRDDGTPADHRRHPLHRGGADHAARRARPPGRRGGDLRRAGRGQLQRRHDHPERAPWARAATPRSPSRSPREDLRAAEQALEPVQAELGISEIDTDPEIGKVSIVGAGMRSHPGVAAKVFETLADEEINIEMISTSPIKISCVIRADESRRRCGRCTPRSSSAPARSSQERPIGQEAR